MRLGQLIICLSGCCQNLDLVIVIVSDRRKFFLFADLLIIRRKRNTKKHDNCNTYLLNGRGKQMRREFAEFNELFPNSITPKKGLFYRFRQWLRRGYWNYLINRIKPGSEKWHEYQQKISLLSSSNADMEIRSLFYEKSFECKGKLYILPGTILCYPYRIKMGYNVFINRGGYITARGPVIIGDNVIIGPGVVINSGMHNYIDKEILIRDQGHRILPIKIEDDVWIGANVVVMPGVTIGKGSVIGAGAVVTTSIPPYSVAVGVPAKIKKKRGEEL